MMAAQSQAANQPRIVLLYCRQTLDPTVKPFEGERPGRDFSARLVLLPCSSKMDTRHLLRVLEGGCDGVTLVACPEKACRFLVGNVRAEKRIAYAQGLLDQVGMGSERLALERGSGLSLEDLMELAAGQAGKVKGLGPNPLKGDSSQ